MPHDRYGRLLEPGDVVKATPYNQHPQRKYVGPIVEMRSDAGQSCTGQMQFVPQGGIAAVTDYFGAEEAELVLKADGTEPALAGLPEECRAADGDDTLKESEGHETTDYTG